MALDPREIRDRTFGRSWRGYDTHEVDAFLDRVAVAHDRALEDAARQRDADELQAQLERADQELLDKSQQVADVEGRLAEVERELAEARQRAAEAQDHAADLEQRLHEQEGPSDPYAHLADEVASVLRHAEEVAATVRERAEADASAVREEAREEAERIRASARELRDAIETERTELLARTRDEAQELLGAALAWHGRLRDVERAVLDRFDDFFSSLQEAGDLLRGSSKQRIESAYELMVQMDMEKLEATLGPDAEEPGPGSS